MNASLPPTDAEVLDALRNRGIDKALAEERQAARESERAGILAELGRIVPEDDANGRRIAALRDEARRAIVLAEAAAAEQRLRVNVLEGELSLCGVRAERLRGELRKLADPRIEAARDRLRNFQGRVRAAFRSREITTQVDAMGTRADVTESNVDEIKQVMGAIRAADSRLESLQFAARPENLAEVIAGIVDPVLLRVQRLAGLAPSEG
ncbi:MAG: hypothetical protein IT510_02830 [Sulfuritalea sp.]|nr:hypothetical protein [Sulfuritalea sp.]